MAGAAAGGHATDAGARAMTEGARAGLALDPTYTAKAFAAALERVERLRDAAGAKTVLYWHTLSSAPMAPLLVGAPDESLVPASVRGLFA